MTASESTIKKVLTGLGLLICCRMGAEREQTIKITPPPREREPAEGLLPTPQRRTLPTHCHGESSISSEGAEYCVWYTITGVDKGKSIFRTICLYMHRRALPAAAAASSLTIVPTLHFLRLTHHSLAPCWLLSSPLPC